MVAAVPAAAGGGAVGAAAAGAPAEDAPAADEPAADEPAADEPAAIEEPAAIGDDEQELLMALGADELLPQFCVIPSCCVGPNPNPLGGPAARRTGTAGRHRRASAALRTGDRPGSAQCAV